MGDLWVSGFSPRFLSAASRCSATNMLAAGSDTLTDYFESRLGYVDYPAYARLSRRLAGENPAGPRVVTVAKETSQALSQIHFVYLDVGCWAGNGGEREWPRHREFGLVHGHLALLCAFVGKDLACPHYSNPPPWRNRGELAGSPLVDAVITRHPDWPPVRQLLDRLQGCIPGSTLRVLGATSLASPYMQVPARGEGAPITVFLGDLHAPVATNSANAHVVENGLEMLRGRLEVNAADLSAVSASPGSDLANLALKAGQRALEALRELQWEQTASRESVESWLRLYHVDGRRTADIFQDAGPDLRGFVDALQDFHEQTWPLELAQLGDLFDLWLGFQRAFGGKLGKVPALDNLHPQALEFARFWVERTLFATEQGPHLVHLLTLGQRATRNKQTGARLPTTFLHGNHDNYLKHGRGHPITVPAGHEHAGMKIRVSHWRSFWPTPALWAEHGHQSDSFNHDEDPRSGHKLTQAAFFAPPVRRFEGPAGWAGSAVNGKDIQRVLSIRHAIRRCLLDHADFPAAPCRGVYVMGHTHEAMLKRVELMPCPPRKYRQAAGGS